MSWKVWLVIFLLFLGLLLRLHHYQYYPQRGATSDEYTYSFLGVSLLTQGKPISWSFLDSYPRTKPLKIEGIYFPIVEPYFDHPPLYGLLVGGWSILNGQNTFQKIQLSTLRLIPIALSLATTLLVFLIANKLWGYETGIIALLIFSTTTTFVMNGKVTVSETLVAFWFVLASYLYIVWEHKIKNKQLLWLGLVSGLSFLTQTISTSLFFSLLALLSAQKIKTKQMAYFVAPFVICVIAYLLYGAFYNWNLFLHVQGFQAGRQIGPQTFWYILSTPIIINKVYFDGWYIFGFFCFLFYIFSNKNLSTKLIPLFYILFLVASLTERGQSGWYIIPLFPFMALAAAHYMQVVIKEKSLFFISFLLFVGLYEINFFHPSASLFKIMLLLLFAPSLVVILREFEFGKKDWGRIVLNMYFYLLILGNAYITFRYVHPL